MSIAALLDQVINISREAGDAIAEVYRSADFGVEIKGDDSPLTKADLAAHNILVPQLAALLEGVPVLSEESQLPDWSERQHWNKYWIIDPLDGTKEFINRNDEFTVNVALIERGVPVLGVVHVPVLETTYAACAQTGAFKIERGERRAIGCRKLAERSGDPLKVVASRRHGAEAVDKLVAGLEQHFGATERVSMGSSLKLCLVAEGCADIYPRLAPTCEWDTAAAQAVVEAAGGQVLKPDFSPLRYNTKAEILNPFFYVIGDTTIDWNNLINNLIKK